MAEGYRSGPCLGNVDRAEPEESVAMPLTRAAAEWKRLTNTKRPHRATLSRWCIKGVRGIRLRGELAGGQWFVTLAELRDFHRRLNEPRPQAVDRSAGPARAAEIARSLAKLGAMIGREVSP